MKKSEIEINNLYVCYCLLKSDKPVWGNEPQQRITETLNRAQDYYERLGAGIFGQAFVYGNGEAALKPFMAYETGFRAALDENVERYAISDALLLSYKILDDFIPKTEGNMSSNGIKNVYRLVIIGDYSLDSSSDAVEILMSKLIELKQRGDFKICYLDVDGQDRAGNLKRMIDARELQ